MHYKKNRMERHTESKKRTPNHAIQFYFLWIENMFWGLVLFSFIYGAHSNSHSLPLFMSVRFFLELTY